MLRLWLVFYITSICAPVYASTWVSDLGNGYYKNPVLYGDYPGFDVIRVDHDFYMVSASYHAVPGIPVLHSKDLVNWTVSGHVLPRLPSDQYRRPAFGKGVSTPSISYHNGLFYVYFCTSDEGLFVATASQVSGPWTLKHVVDVALWRAPSPFWDDDGIAYLLRGEEGSERLFLHRLNPEGDKLLDDGIEIHRIPGETSQSSRVRKKAGWYYLFVAASDTGGQAVLRSRRIIGPYESRVVLNQGNTAINEPHQGRLVELESGEDWFLHLQDKGVYGKVVHLQPLQWKDGWPQIGKDTNSDGVGEPVASWLKPKVATSAPESVPQISDDFEGTVLSPQWQWQGNPQPGWYSLAAEAGFLRLFAVSNPSQAGNFYFVPNLLSQKFAAPRFTVTTRVNFSPKALNDKTGLAVMGEQWGYIALYRTKVGVRIGVFAGQYSPGNDATIELESAAGKFTAEETYRYYLRVSVARGGGYQFSYSDDGDHFLALGKPLQAHPGVMTGASVGLFSLNPGIRESEGYADFDWFRVE